MKKTEMKVVDKKLVVLESFSIDQGGERSNLCLETIHAGKGNTEDEKLWLEEKGRAAFIMVEERVNDVNRTTSMWLSRSEIKALRRALKLALGVVK